MESMPILGNGWKMKISGQNSGLLYPYVFGGVDSEQILKKFDKRSFSNLLEGELMKDLLSYFQNLQSQDFDRLFDVS